MKKLITLIVIMLVIFISCYLYISYANKKSTHQNIYSQTETIIDNQQFKKNLQAASQVIQEENLITDFAGMLHPVNDNVTIKIPLSSQYRLLSRGGIFKKRIAGIFIDKDTEGTNVFDLRHPKDNSSYIAVINMPKQDFEIKKLLPDSDIIFQENNGAIFFDETDDRYHALYIHYDEKAQQLILADYEDNYGYIDTLTSIYSIFRTLSPDHKGEILSFNDLTLTPDQFEEKFQIHIRSEFDDLRFIQDLKQALDQTVNSLLRYTKTYTDEKDFFNDFLLQNLRLKHDSTIGSNNRAIIHYASISDTFKKLYQRNPNGQKYDNVFVWTDNSEQIGYSILLEDNGITYEIRIGSRPTYSNYRNQESELLLTILLNMLFKQLPPLAINQNNDLTNTHHYWPKERDVEKNIPLLAVRNNIINDKGEVVLTLDDYFSSKYLSKKYLAVNNEYLFDTNGELVFNQMPFQYLYEDYFITQIPDTPQHLGIYDVKNKKWVIQSQYKKAEIKDNIIRFYNNESKSIFEDIYTHSLQFLGRATDFYVFPEAQQIILVSDISSQPNFSLYDFSGKLIKSFDENIDVVDFIPQEDLYLLRKYHNKTKHYFLLSTLGTRYTKQYSNYKKEQGQYYLQKMDSDTWQKAQIR